MGFGDRVSGSRGSAPASSGGGGFGSRVNGRRHDGGKGRGGILGAISRLPGDVARDLYDVAVETPAGIAAIHKALADADPTNLQHIGHSDTTKLAELGGAYKESLSEMIEHPLRHPGITALTVVPVVGQASRVLVGGTVASRAALAGEGLRASAAAGVRATVRPTVGERTLTIRGSTARGHYSRATVARGAQKVTDALLETELPGTVRLGQARYAKWNERTLRALEAKERSAGTRVAVLGKDLKPEEQLAFRMVAEEQPVRLRIAAQEMRAARATDPAEIGRHTERIGLQRAAAELLDESSGRPVLRDGRLQHIYDALDRASGERGGILDALGLLDEQAAQAAKVKTAQFAVGGRVFTEQEARSAARGIREASRPVEARMERTGAAEVRAASRRATELEARASRAEVSAFRSGTQRTIAEREARREVDATARAAARATSARVRYGVRGDRGEHAARRLAREQRLAQITYERFQRGEVGPGVVDRAQRRLSKLMDEYERDVGAVVRVRESNRVSAEAIAAHQAAGKAFREAEREAIAAHEQAKAAAQAARGSAKGAAYYRDLVQRVHRTALARRRAAVARAMQENLDRAGRVVGAGDVTVSHDAPFIGNPVERKRLTGRPKVTSRRTLGHTRKPGSLKTATGSAIEHALERHDVTNIVAERHAEAVRLDDVRRRVDLVKDALQPVPSSDKDVWVWTDKTASTEALPQVVRDYLDNPEKLADLPDRAQQSVLQHLRDTVIKKDWNATPETHARFIELAKHGKGGFIPRRMLGNAGKPEPHLPFEPAIDAVNNAQKTALVYLKVSYPVIQTFSNAAMNLIQGAASPAHVARAVRLDRKLPPEYSAMVDDVMGEGAVVQAQFQGQGAIAHMTQKVGQVMSSRVDRPFRKNAFYREAMRKGYETPERIMELFDDDANVNDFVEVAQRGKEAIVDFGEMSPTEQNVVRRILFVYPWQKGAVKYAGHFLRDHPVQAAALGYVGLQGAQIRDETLGPRPSYLAGVFDVGGDRLVNPAGLNFFQTPASIGQALTDPTSGKLQNFLAPAPGIAASFISGRDDIGRPLDKNPAKALYETQIQGIPAVDAAMSWAGHGRSSKSFPDPTDPRWRFFLGGMYPRPYDKGALNRNRAFEKLRR